MSPALIARSLTFVPNPDKNPVDFFSGFLDLLSSSSSLSLSPLDSELDLDVVSTAVLSLLSSSSSLFYYFAFFTDVF